MSPAERETPAGEAMREAVAQKPAPEALRRPVAADIADLLLEGGAVTPYAFACHLLRGARPIASELARLAANNQALTDEANADLERRLADWCRIAELEAALTTLRADHAAEVARLRDELKAAQ